MTLTIKSAIIDGEYVKVEFDLTYDIGTISNVKMQLKSENIKMFAIQNSISIAPFIQGSDLVYSDIYLDTELKVLVSQYLKSQLR